MSVSKAVGVVVVDFHTYDELRGFCESLLECDPQVAYALNIQVVECKDNEAIRASELADTFSGRSLISAVTAHRDNIGFNLACNDGAGWILDLPIEADHMTLAFFNSDTRIKPGVIESCTELLWSDDSFGAVGPRQLDESGRVTAAGIFGTLAHPRHRGWQEFAGDKYQDVRTDCVTASGSAYFTKAPIWKEMSECEVYQEEDPTSEGAFLTNFHYWGETWYSYHLHAHDYKVVYNGDATMIHKWHRASPVGAGLAEASIRKDQAFFRRVCDAHKIPHD